MKALDYAGLVGKFIRVERTNLTEEEEPWGMDCTVLMVRDEPDGSVMIMADYGYGVTLTDGTVDDYRFTVWPNEALAKELRTMNVEAP